MVRAKISTIYNKKPSVFLDSQSIIFQRTHDDRGTFQIESNGSSWPSGEILIIGSMNSEVVGVIIARVDMATLPLSTLFLNVQLWPVMSIAPYNSGGGPALLTVYSVE